MSDPREPLPPEEWTPATSKPGEVFTPEGQIQQAGQFARAIKHRDPRSAPYQRQMWKTGLAVVGIGIAAIVIVSLVLAAIG